MKITIDSETNEVHVEEIDVTIPDSEAMPMVGMILRKFAHRLDPPSTKELIVNEDRMADITDEMTVDFFTHHEGSIH